ncbi:LOW QUALITY PROTEIN: MLO-like protein 9 [Setaria viridis]|uniref:LOW QUALITY PROTEIN: MLO-like protein 9 n=1 Tax=Setaria viridis TaxID=4556 RepID=UPI001493BED5|nr:LOW QUALITY PROTEIN: MLO-like protein 9 [Setaria viridis]
MGGAGGGAATGTRSLDQTPTWAVAAVCAVIVAASILLEGLLHHLGQLLSKKRKKALFDALEKVKSELMTLGFISLLLTVTGRYVSRICIPEGAANTMLPCVRSGHSEAKEPSGHGRRHLSEDSTDLFSCPKGMVSLVSADGMHQLHIFVFFLAVFHVTFSFFTMSLGRAKTRIWKVWEKELPTYEFQYDPSKFRLTHQTSFVRQHASSWSKSAVMLYVVSFFRQFFRSVRRTDYFTLRHGFIAAHLSPGTRFNFRKYIKRSLEDDFKTVVGISPPLWASALAVMLFNVHGWHNLFWFSTIPLVVILAVGTKLQAIIAMMAVEITERHTVIQGMPVVKLSDDHFWFGKPRLVLHLIHFASFQNAFEITYFFWIWYEFGLRSCFHDSFELIIARVCLGAVVQFMCSYITLPLYALVSQMGSQMKRTIFDEQTAKALKKWHKAVVKKKHNKESSDDPSQTPSTDTTTGGTEASEWRRPHEVPVRHLHRYKTIAHVGGTRSPLSDSDYSDTEDAEPLSSSQTRHLIPPAKQRSLDTGGAEVRVDVAAAAPARAVLQDSFSFPRPPPHHVPDKRASV